MLCHILSNVTLSDSHCTPVTSRWLDRHFRHHWVESNSITGSVKFSLEGSQVVLRGLVVLVSWGPRSQVVPDLKGSQVPGGPRRSQVPVGPPQDGDVQRHIDPAAGVPRRVGLCDVADLSGSVSIRRSFSFGSGWLVLNHLSTVQEKHWTKPTWIYTRNFILYAIWEILPCLWIQSSISQIAYIMPDILFLKHDSSILRQSSNPACGFSMMEQVLFGPRETGLALPWAT